ASANDAIIDSELSCLVEFMRPVLFDLASPMLGKNCYIASMTMRYRILASGVGWTAYDNVCTAGPGDPPFEEQHAGVCIAAVTEGSFRYRSSQGRALLAPGAVLLGNFGYCFECGHEHGTGDRCLSFHFTPDHWETIVAAVPGARTATFALPRLPPLPSLIPSIAAIEAACAEGDHAALEELGLRVAGAAPAARAGTGGAVPPPSRRGQRRISDAVRRIAENVQEPVPLSLAALASGAAMSPYHFLRTFRQVVGMTPH